MINRTLRYSLVTLGLVTASQYAIAATPLLQEGKKTLYQRVLTTPNCQLVSKAGDNAGKKVPTFSRYYVYARKNMNNAEWLQVGTNTTGKVVGWFNAQCTVPWNMQMTLTFSPAIDREPLLFFKDQAALNKILESSDTAQAVAPIRNDLKSKGKSTSILAQEPQPTIDFNKHFYLLPILQGQEVSTASGMDMRRLEVASVSEDSSAATSSNAKATQSNANQSNTNQSNASQQKVTEFTSAFVFVIDSSISMDPYIERTRQAVKKIYEDLERKNLGKYAKFGLVAFRSNTQAVPGLEYVSKIFVDPNTVKDSKDFLKKISNLKQATVSSKEFSEDSYAGMETAIENINWKSFGARHIILITDAGALDSDNPLSSTKMDAKQIRAEADVKGIAIWTLHLKTNAGKKNHAQAGRQYRDLSFNDTLQKTLYYPINAGDVNDFGQKMDTLNEVLTEQVALAYQGENAAGSALNDSTPLKNTTQIRKDASLLGQALRLRYIGNEVKNNKAPSIFRAWVSDRDFVKTNTPTAEVRVLLTRAELNALAEKVQLILDAASVGQLSATDMFNRLRDIAGATLQDPNKLSTSTKIADMGILAEYLEGLPYKSEISNVSVDDWKNFTAQDQERILRSLKSKLRQYRKYNQEGDDRWHKLSEDSDKEDWVYPVPLETLP